MDRAPRAEDRSPAGPAARAALPDARSPQQSGQEPESIEEAAGKGISGPGNQLPHSDRLQAAFPGHRLAELRVHVGSAASGAADRLGASAFARGNDLVFADPSPDLFTVAHETVHALQQRAGLRPSGGVGRAGDALERQANAAAADISAGRAPSVDLGNLAPASSAPTAAPALQLMAEAEFNALMERYGAKLVYRALDWLKERSGHPKDAPIASEVKSSLVELVINTLLSGDYSESKWEQNTEFEAALRQGKSIHTAMNCYEFVISYSIQHGYVTVEEAAALYQAADPLSGIPLIWLKQGVPLAAEEYKQCEYGDILFFNAPSMHTAFSLGGNKLIEFLTQKPNESTIEQAAEDYREITAMTQFIGSMGSQLITYHPDQLDEGGTIRRMQDSSDQSDQISNHEFHSLLKSFQNGEQKGIQDLATLSSQIQENHRLGPYREYLAQLMGVLVYRVPRATWISLAKAEAKQLGDSAHEHKAH